MSVDAAGSSLEAEPQLPVFCLCHVVSENDIFIASTWGLCWFFCVELLENQRYMETKVLWSAVCLLKARRVTLTDGAKMSPQFKLLFSSLLWDGQMFRTGKQGYPGWVEAARWLVCVSDDLCRLTEWFGECDPFWEASLVLATKNNNNLL